MFQGSDQWHYSRSLALKEIDPNSYRLVMPMNFRYFLTTLIIFRVQEIVFPLLISSLCLDCESGGFQCVNFNRKYLNAVYLRLAKLSQVPKYRLFKTNIFPFLICSELQQQQKNLKFISGVHENMLNTRGPKMKKRSQRLPIRGFPFII